MHCTLMPHKSYYGDIYRLGLGSYWYVKTINITLTCAKLSKPVGPRVSLSNSYSWRRIIAHHLCSDRELQIFILILIVKNLLNFKPLQALLSPSRTPTHRFITNRMSAMTFAIARDFFKCASLYITRLKN